MQTMRTVYRLGLWLISVAMGSSLMALPLPAADDVLAELQQAKQELTDVKYTLRYKYQPNETLRYTTEQLTTIDTTIGGNHQKTQLRTRSTRSLQVSGVTGEGNIQFAHRIDAVELWSEVSGRQAVQWNSTTGEAPPPEYQPFAANIGQVISVITMSPLGLIVGRQDNVPHPDLGLGGLSIPLPADEISVGHSWSQSIDINVRLDDQRIKTIKTRELYCLEKVETGVATISVKTQILTPLDDARVKSQIIQRISQGELRFDLDSGRMLAKQLDWDESVLGFNGAESNMKYLARFTETLATTAETASLPTASPQ